VASGYDVEVLDGETRKAYYQGVSDTQQVVYFSDMKNGYTYTVKVESRSQTFDGGNYVLSDVFQTTFKTVVQGNLLFMCRTKCIYNFIFSLNNIGIYLTGYVTIPGHVKKMMETSDKHTFTQIYVYLLQRQTHQPG